MNKLISAQAVNMPYLLSKKRRILDNKRTEHNQNISKAEIKNLLLKFK